MIHERILVVDDDPAILKLLGANLKARGYEVFFASDGVEAIEFIEKSLLDLIILDLMMPGMDGMEVCRRVRSWTNIPIIILSARGDEHDKVKCLEMGADDYLTKPFGIAELIARVQNALRHRPNQRTAAGPAVFSNGDLEIHFASRRVLVAGQEIVLTQTEFNLLSFMALNVNKALTHIILLGSVWGDEYSSEKEYLRVFVSRLRRKLGMKADTYPSIQTIPGVGYIFRTGEQPAEERQLAGVVMERK